MPRRSCSIAADQPQSNRPRRDLILRRTAKRGRSAAQHFLLVDAHGIADLVVAQPVPASTQGLQIARRGRCGICARCVVHAQVEGCRPGGARRIAGLRGSCAASTSRRSRRARRSAGRTRSACREGDGTRRRCRRGLPLPQAALPGLGAGVLAPDDGSEERLPC